MKRLLPRVPHLDNFKNEAKALLKAQQDGDASKCEALRQFRRFEGASDEVILAGHGGAVCPRPGLWVSELGGLARAAMVGRRRRMTKTC